MIRKLLKRYAFAPERLVTDDSAARRRAHPESRARQACRHPDLDVHFPTTDGRTLILSRYTEPNADQRVLLDRLSLTLPPQPPPRITAAGLIAGPAFRM